MAKGYRYIDSEKSKVQEEIRAKREQLQLEMELTSAASKYSKIEADVLKSLKQQEVYYRLRQVLEFQNVENRERQSAVLRELISDEKEVATLAFETMNIRKKELPFVQQLANINQRRLEIEAELQTLQQTGHLDAAKQNMLIGELKSLEIARTRYELLGDEKEKWDRIAEIQEKSLNIFGLSVDKVKEFGTNIEKFVTNTWFAIIGLLTLAVAKFVKMGELAADFRRETGLTKDQTEKIAGDAREIFEANKSLGVSYEDTLKASAELFKVLGNTQLITKQNVETIALLGKNWGVSEEASAEYLKTLKTVTGASDESLQQMTNNLLDIATKSGVSASQVISDIAQGSKEGFSYISKYPQEFIKTAVRARQFGLDISKVNNMMKSLLDFETSIGDEIEAALLTGKYINLGAARYYALIGESGKALEAVVNQLGSADEFMKMLPLQQEAMAKAAGMTVDELGTTLKMREAQRAVERGIATDEQRNLIRQQQMQGNVEKMKNAWQAIYNGLSSILLPVVETVAPIIAEIAGWIGSMVDWFSKLNKETGGWAKWVLIGAGSLFAIARINWVGMFRDASRFITETFKFAFRAKPGGIAGMDLSKVLGDRPVTEPTGGGMFKGLGDFIKNIKPTQMLATGAAMVMIAGAVWILAKAMQEFSTGVSWGGVLKGIVAMGALMLAVLGLGTIMASGVGTVAIIAGAAAMLIIAGAMYVLGAAMELIARNLDPVLNFLVGLGAVDAGHILALAGSLATLGIAMQGVAIGATLLGVVQTLFGGGRAEKNEQANKLDTLITAVNDVKDAINKKDFDIYLDGRKVGKGLALAHNY